MKSCYFPVEAFSHAGKIVIQFMPDRLDQVIAKLESASIPHAEASDVDAMKWDEEKAGYVEIPMFRVETAYSEATVTWFFQQDWNER